MIDFLKRHPEKIFYFLLALYLAAGLLNLHILPIAWTDEVMNLDPALQWHKHGKYVGFLWPNKGSDVLFLSYPPLIQWFHIAMLYALPFDIYWMRLPFLLIHVLALFLLFLTLKKTQSGNIWLAVVLSLLFVFDKVVFEISRSMRIEVLETFLVVLLMWTHANKGSLKLKGLILGLLVISHLKMWPFVVIWLLLEWIFNKKTNEKLWMTFIAIFPLLIFLIGIRFQLSELYNQLFSQAQKHQAASLITAKLHGYFIQRFRYVYLEQFWVFAIHLWMLISAAIQLFQSKGRSYAPWVFIGTTLAWLWILAPHYRYWPPLLACGMWVLSGDKYLAVLYKKTWAQKAFIIFIPILISSFVARHAIAWYQREERNTELAGNWLKSELSLNGKTLIVGDAAAFYLSENPNLDYGMDMYPQNLHWNHYKHVYYLGSDTPRLQQMSSYAVPSRSFPAWMKFFVKGQTYAGLKLYKIQSEADWELITGKYADDYR